VLVPALDAALEHRSIGASLLLPRCCYHQAAATTLLLLSHCRCCAPQGTSKLALKTACHQDEDEDLDLADEQDEIDDRIEAHVEELEPEEGGGAAEEAGEEEDSADAQTSAQAALPSAHAAAIRGASRLGRTLKNSQFLADYDPT